MDEHAANAQQIFSLNEAWRQKFEDFKVKYTVAQKRKEWCLEAALKSQCPAIEVVNMAKAMYEFLTADAGPSDDRTQS